MPRPLPPELRERVMALLAAGTSVTEIAHRLQISRMTVYRYRTAAQEQQQEVPQPQPAGGYRRIGAANCSVMRSGPWPPWRCNIPKIHWRSYKTAP